MEAIDLAVEERKERGSGPIRRLRLTGKVPAVVYAEGNPATAIVLDEHEYKLAVRGATSTQIFRFKSENAELNGITSLIRSVQIEPLKGRVMHVDFIAVHEGHRVPVTVPVSIIGECPAVKENRAILNQTAYEIEVECMPSQIPDSLTLDVSFMREGQTLHASDIELPPDVVLRSIPGLSVVSIIEKKLIAAEEPATTGVAAAAGGETAASS